MVDPPQDRRQGGDRRQGHQGEPGDTGAQGEPGIRGQVGPEGAPGATGRAGAAGRDLTEEVRSVRQDVGRLANAVTHLGSDERLAVAVASVAEEERRHRQRLIAAILVPLLAIGILGAANLSTSQDIKRIAVSNQRIAAYIDHCLVHTERRTVEECGTSAGGGTSGAVVALVDFQSCALLIQPEDRTRNSLDACAQQAFAKLTPSTTTTTRP